MKAILMSIRPQHDKNILNGIKTLEIRKKFPKDYVGWVYIYCTKDSKKGWCMVGINGNETYYQKYDKNAVYSTAHNYIGNGKVVARFWCDKVEEIKRIYLSWNDKIFAWETETLSQGQLEIKACLETKELCNYLAFKENGYAIHITNLEIFDKPKEISEFYGIVKTDIGYCFNDIEKQKPITLNACKQLTRAPQSWCYVEV